MDKHNVTELSVKEPSPEAETVQDVRVHKRKRIIVGICIALSAIGISILIGVVLGIVGIKHFII